MLCLLTAAFVSCTQSVPESSREMVLWYDQPAGEVWLDGLLIGNGYMGGNVFGSHVDIHSGGTLCLDDARGFGGFANDTAEELDEAGRIFVSGLAQFQGLVSALHQGARVDQLRNGPVQSARFFPDKFTKRKIRITGHWR